MSTRNIIQLILIIIGIFLSAFFSSSETALTSVNIFKIRQMEKNGVEKAPLVRRLVDDIGSVLTTILIGNNIVNIVTTTIATIFFTEVMGKRGAVVSPIILTIVVLIFGEVTPKNIASANSEDLAIKVAGPIRLCHLILKPINFILGKITGAISRALIGENEDNSLVTEEDLKTIVDVSEEQGVINNEESEMINNVFDFGNSDVSDIMTPRTNMQAIAVDADQEELNEILRETNHSRIPVYGKNIDNVLGILHMKDIVAAIASGKEIKLDEIIRPAFYVYDNMHIFDLFTNMRADNVSLAIVIDEYGGTSGLVTIEDIVEELVGEIDDEYDTDDQDIFKLTEKSYLVRPSLHLSDFNDYFDLDIEEIKNDSIGGFVIDQLSRIPVKGDQITVGNMEITVDEVDRYKIEMLKVEFL